MPVSKKVFVRSQLRAGQALFSRAPSTIFVVVVVVVVVCLFVFVFCWWWWWVFFFLFVLFFVFLFFGKLTGVCGLTEKTGMPLKRGLTDWSSSPPPPPSLSLSLSLISND